MKDLFSFSAVKELKTKVAINNEINVEEIEKTYFSGQNEFYFVDTRFKSSFPELKGFFLKAYPIVGDEKCKSIDRFFELVTVLQTLEEIPSRVSAVGGGALLELVGYVVSTTMPHIQFRAIPSTLEAQFKGCYSGRFFIDFGRKRDRLFVDAFPDETIILVNLLKKSGIANIRKAHIIALSLGIGYDERFFHLVIKSLSLLKDNYIDWELLSELIRESNHLHARIYSGKTGIFPGESLMTFFQNASGLQMEYIEARIRGTYLELFIALKLGVLDSEIYKTIKNTLSSLALISSGSKEFDIQTLFSMIKEEKRVWIQLITGLGSSKQISLESNIIENLLKDFFLEGEM